MIRSMNFYRGLALGAGLMYLLDPDEGKSRRATLGDRLSRARKGAQGFVGDATPDLDDGIAGRVRAKLAGYVSHPGALSVEARYGSVTLSGPVLRGEAEALIGAVSSVRGVREVLNRLEPHDPDEDLPGLHGPGRHGESRSRRVVMTPGLQLMAGVLGATAVAYGAGRIVARLRDARRDELEREMPEYAMLR